MAGNSKIKEQKKRGKRDRPQTDNMTISVTLFFQRILLIAQFFNNGDVML
jgi:hypothetical protein